MTTTNTVLMTFRRSLAVAGALAALTMTSAAFADSQVDMTQSVAVKYGDLDLSTDAGVRTLYQRISGAARQVCPDMHSRDLTIASAGARCEVAAVEQAVRQVNNSKLAAVHATRVAHG